ncbi:hypothetical protein SRHO_G00191050 [Serrasalmus rhombeus]
MRDRIWREAANLTSSSSTNTMFLTSLLLLLMAGCVQSQVVLTQSERPVTVTPDVHGISLSSSPAQLKPPGESVRLSCEVSGYRLSDYDVKGYTVKLEVQEIQT